MGPLHPVRLKIFAVMLFAALVTVAVACGSDNPAADPTATPTPLPTTPTPTPTGTVPTGPTATPTPADLALQAQLDSARARWTANRPQSYTFDLTWYCFCAYAGNTIRITVNGSEIVRAVELPVEPGARAPEHGPRMTIDELFNWIQTALDTDNAKVLSVEFERDLGYPVSAAIDRLVGATDAGQSFTVTNFRLGDQEIDLDQLRRDLDAATSRWFESGPQSYQFVFWWECFCPPDITTPVRIEVRSGQIVSIVDAGTGLPVEEYLGREYRTVPELFSWISERLDRNPDFADLQFGPETGHPLKARFDPIINLYDDEEAFFIQELSPLDVHVELKKELEAARAIWTAQGLTGYSYHFNWSCFCLQEFVAQVTITVRNGLVTNVIRVEDGRPVSDQFIDQFVTVEALFDRLDDAVSAGAASISAVFDPETGVPTSVFIDYNFQIADEEMGWNASDVTELD